MPSAAFIGRQPVLNRNQQIIGYELLFRLDGQAVTADFDSDLQAGISVLANTLANMSAGWLIGNKLAFINVGERMLMSEFLELLHPQRVVLEINPSITCNEEVIQRAKRLRAQGFGIALDDFALGTTQAQLLGIANYVKVDILHADVNRLPQISQDLRKHAVIQLAEKVETREHLRLARDAGFDGFQGHYFARPETLSAKTIHPNLSNIIVILNLLRKNAEIPDIERAMKADVAMSYKLFRYINSVGFALCSEITSIRQALTLLGYQKLYRWLTLLLVSAGEEAGLPPALLKTTVTRGRFAELVGQSIRHRSNNDDLFITGMFSLLDVILDMPMSEVLDNMLLPEEVREALLERRGLFGTVLQLIEACEDPQMTQVQALSEQLGLSANEINQAHVNALAWVEELGI